MIYKKKIDKKLHFCDINTYYLFGSENLNVISYHLCALELLLHILYVSMVFIVTYLNRLV